MKATVTLAYERMLVKSFDNAAKAVAANDFAAYADAVKMVEFFVKKLN